MDFGDNSLSDVFLTICGIYAIPRNDAEANWKSLTDKTLSDFSRYLTQVVTLSEAQTGALQKLTDSKDQDSQQNLAAFAQSLEEDKKKEIFDKLVELFVGNLQSFYETTSQNKPADQREVVSAYLKTKGPP